MKAYLVTAYDSNGDIMVVAHVEDSQDRPPSDLAAHAMEQTGAMRVIVYELTQVFESTRNGKGESDAEHQQPTD